MHTVPTDPESADSTSSAKLADRGCHKKRPSFRHCALFAWQYSKVFGHQFVPLRNLSGIVGRQFAGRDPVSPLTRHARTVGQVPSTSQMTESSWRELLRKVREGRRLEHFSGRRARPRFQFNNRGAQFLTFLPLLPRDPRPKSLGARIKTQPGSGRKRPPSLRLPQMETGAQLRKDIRKPRHAAEQLCAAATLLHQP